MNLFKERRLLTGVHHIFLWCALSVLLLPVAARCEPPDAGKCIVVELFSRDDCKNCPAAAEFLDQLQKRHPRTRLVKWDLDRDAKAVSRLKTIAAAFKIAQPSIPSVYLCRRLISGFEDDQTTGKEIENLFTIHVYWREGCPRCARGKQFLNELLRKHPVFEVQYHEIVKDAAARQRFDELSRQFRIQAPVVPTFHLGGQLVTGYLDDASTGKRLEELVTGGLGSCPPHEPPAPAVPSQGWHLPPFDWRAATLALMEVTAETTSTPPVADAMADDLPLPEPAPESESADDTMTVPFFGKLQVKEIGLPAFTLAIGLVDGFNPCAMWVLLFLLSILVNLHDRWKILAVAGTFVVVSGLVYLAFMAAWLNVFLLIGYMRWAQIVLGCLAVVIGAINVKDFFAFKWGVSLSIPESAKPGIYARVREIVSAKYLWVAITGAMVLAVLVNAVELLCSAGFPAMYTQILTLQELPAWENYLYLGLYISAYMFDDSVMVAIVVITLAKTKLQETGGRWLKLLSGVVILALGVVMLLKPEWLG